MPKKNTTEIDVAGGLAVEAICEAADAHGADNGDPEYAVGDLQLVLGEAFKRLSQKEIIGEDFFT